MKQIPIEQLEDSLTAALRIAGEDDLLITENGFPRFRITTYDEDDAWEDALLKDPRFIERCERGRQQLRDGLGVRLEDLPE